MAKMVKWGFREVARHLGISWRLARKWGAEGILPVLPESKWEKGPVTVFRRHFKRTPFGPEYTHTTEEDRIVDKVFSAKAIQALDMDEIRERLVFKRLDEHEAEVLALIAELSPQPKKQTKAELRRSRNDGVGATARRLADWGVTFDGLTRWLDGRGA